MNYCLKWKQTTQDKQTRTNNETEKQNQHDKNTRIVGKQCFSKSRNTTKTKSKQNKNILKTKPT